MDWLRVFTFTDSMEKPTQGRKNSHLSGDTIMEILKTFVVVLFGLAVALGLAGCEKKSSGPEPETYSSIIVEVVDDFERPIDVRHFVPSADVGLDVPRIDK